MDLSSNKIKVKSNIIPIIIDTSNNNEINTTNNTFDIYDITYDMKIAYGYSNFIKLLCSVKLFFSFISTMIQSYLYMYSFIIPIVGYIGAIKYSNIFNYLHIFLLSLHNIYNISFMIYFYSNNINNEKYNIWNYRRIRFFSMFMDY